MEEQQIKKALAPAQGEALKLPLEDEPLETPTTGATATSNTIHLLGEVGVEFGFSLTGEFTTGDDTAKRGANQMN